VSLPRTLDILLVEDSDTDALLATEAIAAAAVDARLHRVVDGLAAMDYLLARGAYAQAQRPDLVLLDLNLPRRDGREVLAEIKQTETLRRIPVVVLTTSAYEQDVLSAYDRHANCYVVKPVDFHEFVEAMKRLERFWLETAVLPPHGA